MLPAADFNFVVCGIATIAASVGYACARKIRPLPSFRRNTPQQLDSLESLISNAGEVSATFEKQAAEPVAPNDEPPLPDLKSGSIVPSGNNSLKRKRVLEQDQQDQHDEDVVEGYPHNLKSIYPNKRRSGSVSEQEPNIEEMLVSASVISTEQPQASESPPSEPLSAPPTKPDITEDSAVPDVHSPEPTTAPTPEPVPAEIPRFVFPETPPRVVQFPSTRSSASPGFAIFAGTSSPFSALNVSKEPTFGKSIWTGHTGTEDSALESKAQNLDGECGQKKGSTALAAAKIPTLAIQTLVTGEEDEDVVMELKGAKLFVKRGDDNFSGGMLGHFKVLSNKTTLSKRLLFRREPLWKVSMNVRMLPTVRYTFDTQEKILRIALKELDPEKPGSAPQTVIYAFKPGRSCRRCDFEDFAESLLAQARVVDQS
ncbi:hypothetical protein B0H15DRAFT_839001 [Mycena belliarum]|uniref:RanBD1 domain-containing protein n=1 Tax=Mycena belliarum TaxID=1033014 RepID=A0AAD6XRE7_9AGAR|nr:hypothetical protein B0H15DRAFT_839001 [Mycena belliae]